MLLLTAFTVAMTATLIVAQLGGERGLVRAVRVPCTVLWRESLAFALAISVTLLGGWVRGGAFRYCLRHASSFLTLAFLLATPVCFWRAQQNVSAEGIITEAVRQAKAKPEFRTDVTDVLVSAARRNDYVVFRAGVRHLQTVPPDGMVYLEDIRRHLNESTDSYAIGIVNTELNDHALPLAPPPDQGKDPRGGRLIVFGIVALGICPAVGILSELSRKRK